MKLNCHTSKLALVLTTTVLMSAFSHVAFAGSYTAAYASETASSEISAESRASAYYSHRRGPIGSWQATIADSVQVMYSFLPGGVVIESDNPALDPNFGNLAFSNGHGAWTRTGYSSFEFIYHKYGYDDQGQLVAVGQSRGVIEMVDSETFEGTINMGETDMPITGTRILVGASE